MTANRSAAESLFHEGNDLMAAGEFSRAEERFRESVAADPDFAEAHANIGYLLDRRGDFAGAEAAYIKSISLNPNYQEVYLNLGALLAARKRFEEAGAAYGAAVTLNPESAAAWSNIGVLFACTKREEIAEICYRKALAIDEKYAKASFNLSYLLLRQGRFAEGWRRLEARGWYERMEKHFTMPRWRGEPLSGRSVIICFEAGLGDMIQFCRYAAVLKERGAASVALVCHPPLKRLFESLSAVDKLYSYDEDVPASGWDFWTPPLSIPCHCETRADSIPADIPYLSARPDLIEKWKAALPEGRARVGLVWKGNPKFENDADRSLGSLELLKPFGAVPNVSFVSLQKGAGEDEALNPPEGLKITHLGRALGDFADTAAVIAGLDLVICVDTAVAHLAGSLGKPCWVMLPDYVADWRWLDGRSDSPWYPAMRLFRQAKAGEWNDVVASIASALEKFVEARK